MDDDAFSHSQEDGTHRWFGTLVGRWQGTARTWTNPDGEPDDESDIRGTIRLLLDGRFLLHEYETTLFGHPCRGLALYGHDLQTDQFQSAWVDDCHNGTRMMFSEGSEGPFSVLGHYPVAGDEEWGWRTEITSTGEEQMKITAYNISPAGEEAKAIEIVYTRSEQ